MADAEQKKIDEEKACAEECDGCEKHTEPRKAESAAPHKKESKKNKTEEELEKALAQAEDYKRKWYSVSAEYDNYRKRTSAASSQAYADGKAEAILKLLPVADNFGYAYMSASDEKTKAGVDKIVKNFNTIINSLGVEEIAVNEGDKFDEKFMEAIMNVPAGEGEEPNLVKAVLKKGYKQGDKIIRFAQVSVTV